MSTAGWAVKVRSQFLSLRQPNLVRRTSQAPRVQDSADFADVLGGAPSVALERVRRMHFSPQPLYQLRKSDSHFAASQCVQGRSISNPSPPAKSHFSLISCSRPSQCARRWSRFPQAYQTARERSRPLRHPPSCSSIVRNSAAGVFRAIPASRTVFEHSVRGREVRHLCPDTICRPPGAARSRAGSEAVPPATGSTSSRKTPRQPLHRACRRTWRESADDSRRKRRRRNGGACHFFGSSWRRADNDVEAARGVARSVGSDRNLGAR